MTQRNSPLTRRNALTAIAATVTTAIAGCASGTAPRARLPSDNPEAVAEAYVNAHINNDRATAEELVHDNADIDITFTEPTGNNEILSTEQLTRNEYVTKYVIDEKPDFSELPGNATGTESTFVKVTMQAPEIECCSVSAFAFLVKEHGHWRIYDAY